MSTSLQALQQRVDEIERLADEVVHLAEQVRDGKPVYSELSVQGQRWYRGARELLVQQGFSGLNEFDACYDTSLRPDSKRSSGRPVRWHDIELYLRIAPGTSAALAKEPFEGFSSCFQKARALFVSVVDEAASRALPMRTQLSLAVSADELNKAEEILAHWGGDEVMLRASGVIARVALERHLFTLAETKGVAINVNPPSKREAGVEDVLVSLQKAGVITPIQKAQLDSLFKIANECGHPKDRVTEADVKRLITEGRQLASVLV